MPLLEFLTLMSGDSVLHGIAFVVIFTLLCLLFRKQIFMVFDPLLFSLFMISASILCVLSLYYYNFVSLPVLATFLLIKCSIFAGITSKRSLKYRRGNSGHQNKHHQGSASTEIISLKLFFILSFATYLCITIYLYSKLGLPILMPPLPGDFFKEYGVLARLKGFFMPMVIMCIMVFTLVYYKYTKFKWLSYFALLVVMFDGVINASKSNFVTIVLYWGLQLYYLTIKGYVDQTHAKKFTKTLFALAIASVIAFVVIIIAKTKASGLDFAATGLTTIIGAFIARGDIYVYLMPYFDEIQRQFGSTSIFNIFFAPVLATFRLMDSNDVIGIPSLIMEYTLGYDPKGNGVPNVRLTAILMLLCNLPVGMLIGYVVGSCISFIRNKLILLLPNSVFSLFYVTSMAFLAPNLIIDVGETITAFGLTTALFSFFLMITHILASASTSPAKLTAPDLL